MLGKVRRQSYEAKRTTVLLINCRCFIRLELDNASVGGIHIHVLEIDSKNRR
jgi:hypothetical protein